jgi:mannose-6-phosphate isomerase-like protein (cupin superfamily)
LNEENMKLPLAIVVILTAAVLTAGAIHMAAQTPPVAFADHDKVAAALANGGSLITAPNLTVSGAHRTGPGQVEVHETETDVLYIIEGEATFVTGGTMVGGKLTRPGQHLGTDIQGGTTHHLTKGDVITIQAGTPHWFQDVPKSVNYFVVKVLK